MKRTTLEIDEMLLARAKRALGKATARATVEEALRRVADAAQTSQEEAAERERQFFKRLISHVDVDVLRSEDMWR